MTTTYTRFPNGNVRQKTDAMQRSVDYDYSWGRVSSEVTTLFSVRRKINVDGTVMWEGRDAAATMDPERKTWFQYDGLGREISRTPPLGFATGTDYTHEGDPSASITITRGTTWTTTYLDGFGRVLETENNGGVHTRAQFDAWGRKTFQSYPYAGGSGPDPSAGIGTHFTYDVLDRVAQKTEADGTVTTFSPDVDGAHRQTTGITEPYRDQETRTTVQTWEATGHPDAKRLVNVRDALDHDTTYAYNELDKLTVVQSPGIAARRYEYFEGTDQLRTETHPESGSTGYTYDDNGQLRTRTDAAGRTLTYEYDDVNRLISITSSSDATYSTAIAYDDPYTDNRTEISNDYAETTRVYDAAGRVTSRTDVLRVDPNGASRTFTTSYVPNDYDAVASITYFSGRTVTYSYDALQRISGVSDGTLTYASGITYHPSGQVADSSAGNGVESHMAYWALTYRPETIVHRLGSSTLLGLSYDYYRDGNIRAIDDGRPGESTPGGRVSFENGHDMLDRLTAATGPWGPVSYTYDEVGNRQTKTSAAGTSTYHYAQGALGPNRLDAVTGAEPESFGYNDAGELTSDSNGNAIFTYTPTGSMATAILNGQTLTHRYDGDDLRSVKVKQGVVHYYVRDTSGRVLAEYEEQGGALIWTVDYVYAGSRLLATVHPVPAGDFNGDGKADLFWHHVGSGQNILWYMNGLVAGGWDTIVASPATSRHVATADVDADGRPDVVWRDGTTGATTIWYMRGKEKVGEAALPAIADAAWRIAGAGDFNGDGHADLVWRNFTTGDNLVWLLNGAAFVGWAPLPSVADTAWRIVGVAVLSGDGQPDLVWRNATTGQNLVWFLSGTIYTGWAALPPAPLPWWIVGTGDFNGDRQTDLLWRNLTTGENLVWFFQGTTYADWGTIDTVPDVGWVIGPDTEPAPGGEALAGGPNLVVGGPQQSLSDAGQVGPRAEDPTVVMAGRTGAASMAMPDPPPLAIASMPPAPRPALGVPPAMIARSGARVLMSPALPMSPATAPTARSSTSAVAAMASFAPLGATASGMRVAYYHSDALGSTRLVTDGNGRAVRYHDYLPFGEEWQPDPNQTEKRLFTGQERDFETALDYFGARYYRADIGRFTTVDPELDIKAALVDPQRWNRYAYVTNNPLRYADPDGKNPFLIGGGIGAAVYGGWAIYQNVSHGKPWYNNVGMEASKGFLVGVTLALAAPAVAGIGGAADLGGVGATGTV